VFLYLHSFIVQLFCFVLVHDFISFYSYYFWSSNCATHLLLSIPVQTLLSASKLSPKNTRVESSLIPFCFGGFLSWRQATFLKLNYLLQFCNNNNVICLLFYLSSPLQGYCHLLCVLVFSLWLRVSVESTSVCSCDKVHTPTFIHLLFSTARFFGSYQSRLTFFHDLFPQFFHLLCCLTCCYSGTEVENRLKCDVKKPIRRQGCSDVLKKILQFVIDFVLRLS